jgi:hypothetical protein
MSLEDIIANYIAQQRSLGKRYSAEVKILAAFRLSVSDVRLRDIRPEMISRFVERGGTSDETRSKKFRVLSGLFLFAVTRHQLRTSPMPQRPRKRTYSITTPRLRRPACAFALPDRRETASRTHSACQLSHRPACGHSTR